MDEYSIAEIHDKLTKGDLTSEKLVGMYLQRIEEIDSEGPKLNSVIEINPEARVIARKLDQMLVDTGMVGPLHGIPVLIKDNIDTLEGMQTTAGSITIEKYGGTPQEDAFVVQQLRNAGAIILGKTNLSEMANFRGMRSISGWSSRGGRTKNPHVLNRNPSGSSSGSGVAVAANLATVAIGTETDGSVISPASANGIVGIKPSIGLVSRSGIIPIAHSQDTAGPMARTVEDAARLLEVMVGYDPQDSVTEDAKDIETDYTTALRTDTLQGAKLGIFRKRFGFHRKVDEIMERQLKILEEAGAELIDPLEIEYPEDWDSQEMTVLLYEYKKGLNSYFASRQNSDIHNIDDLIRLNKENAENTMPYFGQEHVENAAEKEGLGSEEYQQAMTKYEELRSNVSDVFEEHSLDAIVAPSGGPAWLTDLLHGDYGYGGSSQLAAVTGFCNITVPAGNIENLPVGISFIGGQYQERKIISLAYAYEQRTNHRVQPTFISSISMEK